jgi:ABC-2 type transport system permease protein
MKTLHFPGQRPAHSLWFFVIKLLRLRWVIWVSGFKRAKTIRKIFTILIGLLLIGFFAGSLVLTILALKYLESPAFLESGLDLTSIVDAIPVLIVSVSFIVILMTSFGVLLQALYLAHDMDFLLAAPIPIKAVFLTKLIQAILSNLVIIGVFGIPVLFGMGVSGKYHLLYFPLVLVVLAFLSLSAAGIASLLVMAVVRIFPAKRVAEVLAFVGAVISITLSQIGNFTRGSGLGTITAEQISKGNGVLSTLRSGWSPLSWAGQALVDMGEGRWLSGTFFLLLTLGLCGGVFWLALNGAQHLYYSGWASVQTGTQRKKTARATGQYEKKSIKADFLQRFLPSQVRAILVKDFLELRRDLRNMSQVVTPMILGILYSVMILRSGGNPPAGQGEAPQIFMEVLRTAMMYGSVGIALFVGSSLLSRLALMSFSMEGKSYWIIKTSPVKVKNLILGKFLIAYLPSLSLGWLFLMGIAVLQKTRLVIVLYGFPVVAFVFAGMVGINLAFGIRGAKFNWSDPRKMAGGVAVFFGGLASLFYLLLCLILFFAPPIGFPLLQLSEGAGQIAGLLTGGIFSLLCAVLPPLWVRGRIDRMGEAETG